jgi:Xaa-Pro aminopeptidase
MRPNAQKLLAKTGVPALLLSNPLNIRYMTGIPAEHGILLVQKKGMTLFVNVLELEATKARKTSAVVRDLSALEAAMKNVRVCGYEEHHVTVARLKRWKKLFPKTTWKGLNETAEAFRRIKDADELKAILKANSITEEILVLIPSILKPGITEAGVGWIIESFARELGAEKMGFETIVAFGSNTSRPHHRPTDKKLKKHDIIQIDMGVVINGYTSDRSAVYFKGKPTAKQKEVLSALEEAKNAGIDAIAPGVSCSEPDLAARKVLRAHKLEKYFIHSLGHGVGLDIHEGVTLSKKSKQILQEQEVVTVEPGVYFPGKWGMRLEDMVVVQ